MEVMGRMFFPESTWRLRPRSSRLLLEYIDSVFVLHLQLEETKQEHSLVDLGMLGVAVQ